MRCQNVQKLLYIFRRPSFFPTLQISQNTSDMSGIHLMCSIRKPSSSNFMIKPREQVMLFYFIQVFVARGLCLYKNILQLDVWINVSKGGDNFLCVCRCSKSVTFERMKCVLHVFKISCALKFECIENTFYVSKCNRL